VYGRSLVGAGLLVARRAHVGRGWFWWLPEIALWRVWVRKRRVDLDDPDAPFAAGWFIG